MIDASTCSTAWRPRGRADAPRVVGRSVMTLPEFWLAPEANELEERGTAASEASPPNRKPSEDLPPAVRETRVLLRSRRELSVNIFFRLLGPGDAGGGCKRALERGATADCPNPD